MIPFFQIQSYITYWLDAVDEHSLHSPFLFDFYTKVVKPSATQSGHPEFENLRKKLLENEMTILVNDLGAGSKKLATSSRKVKDIAQNSLTPLKYSVLYHKILQYFQCKTIIELGTCFGINTVYLADTLGVHVTTFEGDHETAEIARSTFEFANAKNITLHEGDIQTTLPSVLPNLRKFDFAFLDANHRYEPTIRYFELLLKKVHTKSIMVMDDIHQSKEMEKAWKSVKEHPLVYASADLYRCGILFFDPSLNRQHVVLQG